MKKKRSDRVDRRRPLIEMNLISERTKGRSVGKRRGCINPFAILMLASVPLVVGWLGLH